MGLSRLRVLGTNVHCDERMKGRRRLKVLSFTTLFPNRVQPLHGIFVKNRLEKMAAQCDLSIVAPVNIVQDPRLLWRVPKRELTGGISVHHPRFGVVPGVLKHWDGQLLFRQTIQQIRGSEALAECDVLDVHYAYPDGVAGQRLAQEVKRPFVISLRGSDIHVLAQFPRRGRLICEMLDQAHAIIAVSKALRSAAEGLGADHQKIYVIPNGVDKTVFFPRDRVEARRKLGWSLDTRVILAVGRLVPVKGFDLLIRAMQVLRDRLGKGVRCFMVGEGELRSRFEDEIRNLGLEENVILCGRMLPRDLALCYSAADVFCLVSRSEGCPNVVLESLACGTPVVAMDVGGVAELVRHEVTGFLIRHQNEEEVAYYLEEALGRTWERSTIARSEAVRDWSEVAGVQVQLLHEIVGRY